MRGCERAIGVLELVSGLCLDRRGLPRVRGAPGLALQRTRHLSRADPRPARRALKRTVRRLSIKLARRIAYGVPETLRERPEQVRDRDRDAEGSRAGAV